MIRKIQVTDAESIKKINELSLGYITTVELVERQILKFKEDKNHIILLFEEEATGDVVGYIQAERYESLCSEGGVNILGFAVLPKYQGKGIGKALLLAFEQEAKAKGHRFIRLNSGEERTDAHHFYHHMGYHFDKLQKRFSKQL